MRITLMPALAAGIVLFGFALISVSWQNSGILVGPTLPQENRLTKVQASSSSAETIDGTITVVISTRQGFVLAADSRSTHRTTSTDGTQSIHTTDDAQKLFQIGDRTACVIAGLSGRELPGHREYRVFRVRDAIASYFTLLDQSSRTRNISPDAKDVALSFERGFAGVAGLAEWLPDRGPSHDVGEISVVSFDRSGKPQWYSFRLLAEMVRSANGRSLLVTGNPVVYRSQIGQPLGFDKLPLGQPQVANRLMDADKPGTDRFSQSQIMKKYYMMKRRGRLDEVTLKDAVRLAEVIVRATEELAPPEAGVGGPIDVATVTPAGVHWIRKKTNVAPVPAPFRARYAGGNLPVNKAPFGMNLDGIQCISCTIADGSLFFYDGDADTELIDPEFQGAGRCSVILRDGANRKRPDAVRRLISALGNRCNFSGDLPNPSGLMPPD
jgi:hypothetical protein